MVVVVGEGGDPGLELCWCVLVCTLVSREEDCHAKPHARVDTLTHTHTRIRTHTHARSRSQAGTDSARRCGRLRRG